MSTLKLVPGYFALLGARALSSTIIWVDFTLIFSLLSYAWHADASTIGLASALYGLPGLILGPFFGALADRTNPIVMLAASYFARALTSLLLFFCTDINVFLLLVFFKGLANLGVMPSEQIMVRTILSKEQLVSNISLMTTIDQLCKIGAPLIGAGMASLSRPGAGFALSAALGCIGIVCLYPLRHYGSIARAHQAQAQRHLQVLWQLIRHNKVFGWAFSAALVQTTILGLYDPLLALFLKERGLPAGTFGLIVSSTAVGAILGALLFKRIHAKNHYRTAAYGLGGFGLTVALPGLLALTNMGVPVWLLLGLWVINGCSYGLTSMSFVVSMQQQCPVQSLGTVSATARSSQLFALVVGPLVGALLAKLIGIPMVFLLSGMIAIMFASVLGRITRSHLRKWVLEDRVPSSK